MKDKQTAVEWLVQQIETGKIEIVYSEKIHSIRCLPEFVKQALEIEKQQIIDAKDCWFEDERDGEQYYDETFGDVE